MGRQELRPITIQKIIKNGFKVTRIWPLNPKAMDHKTRLSEFTQQHLQTSQMKIVRVLMIQLTGKRNG
jgi:hypothetical protein